MQQVQRRLAATVPRWNLLPKKRTNFVRAMSTSGEAPVICDVRGAVANVLLNRPKALNALDHQMVQELTPRYLEWNQPGSSVAAVVMKGAGGKAFCAGGDIVAIRTLAVEGRAMAEVCRFFKEEYHLNYLIGTATTPQVALLNGITMGGGVGLSVHGRYRVATDNTMFAMPETAIGFFPDVGGTHFLPRLPGSIGMFLALTGTRLKGPEVALTGIATHFVSLDRMGALEEALAEIKSSDEVENILADFNEEAKTPSGSVLEEETLAKINSCFSHGSVDEIVAALEADGSDWAKKQLKLLGRMSPLGLQVTFRQLDESRKQKLSLAECLRTEYRVTLRIMADGEFSEGVRSLLVDKDKSPQWNTQELQSRVEACFAPLDANTEDTEWEPL